LWAILGVLCQGLVSWLGWAMNHESISAGNRKWAHAGFIGLTMVGMLSIGIVTYRAGRTERAHFQMSADISAVVQGTIDAWSQQADWLPVNAPIRSNVNFRDVGNGPGTNCSNIGHAYLEPDASLSSTRDAVSKFNEWLKLQPPKGKGTLGKDEPKWNTYFGDILTPEDFMNVRFGRRRLYEVGTLWFDDDTGSHYQNFCYRLQPPQPRGMVIFSDCEEHTDEGDVPGWFMHFFR